MYARYDSPRSDLIELRFDLAQMLRGVPGNTGLSPSGASASARAGAGTLSALEAHIDDGALVLRCAAVPPFVRRGATRLDRASASDRPTVRELDVLALVREGRRNREIATLLSISPDAVKTRLKNAMAKLSASNRTHAVTLAVQRGWLDDGVDVVGAR